MINSDRCARAHPHAPHRSDRGPFGVKHCPGVPLPPSVELDDPQPAGQAPVTGYTKQPPENVRLANAIKDIENIVGELVTEVSEHSHEHLGTDPRMVALARTNLQQGFMWLVRAVFQPESRL